MSTNLGTLKVSIGADTKDLARGIGRAKAHVQSFAKVAKVGALAAGAAFAAASVGMVAMAKGGLSFVDAQAKMARQLDGSIDGLRALQIATGDAGVSTDVINKAVEMMGKRLAEAARRGIGPAYDALERLNLSAADLMAMDIDQRFATIADRVNELGMNAQEAGDLMRQFGVRNGEVANALLQGSAAIRSARQEVEEFGLSIGGEAAAGVERANDALSRIKFVFEGLGNQLAVTVAPVLETLAGRFKSLAGEGGPLQEAVGRLVASFGDLANQILDPAFIDAAVLLGTTIAGAVVSLTKAMGFLIENAEIAGTVMIALGGAMAFFSGPIGLAIAAVAGGVFLLSSRLGESETAADDAAEAEARLQAALDLVDVSNDAAVESGGRLIETHIDQARAAVEAAKAELALARSKQAAANALLDQNPLTAGGDSGYAEAMAENTAAIEAELTAAEALIERYQKKLEGFRRSQFPSQGAPSEGDNGASGAGDFPPSDTAVTDKLTAKLDALTASLDPAVAASQKYAQALVVLNQALAAGLLTQEEYYLWVEQIDEQLARVPETANAAAAGVGALRQELKKIDQTTDSTMSDVEGIFGRLLDGLDDGTAALKRFALEMIKLMAIKGISAILGNSDWLDSPYASSPKTASITVSKNTLGNALGTDNWRGGLSWVGERGPEIVNLPRGAQVIPNNVLGAMSGGGGGQNVFAPSVTINAESSDPAAIVRALRPVMRDEAASFFNRKQRGGI